MVLDFESFTSTYDYKNNKVRRRKGKGSAYLSVEGEIEDLKFYQPNPKLIKIEIKSKNLELKTKAYCRNE